LKTLPISDPAYVEIAVYSMAPRPAKTIRQIAGWVAAQT